MSAGNGVRAGSATRDDESSFPQRSGPFLLGHFQLAITDSSDDLPGPGRFAQLASGDNQVVIAVRLPSACAHPFAVAILPKYPDESARRKECFRQAPLCVVNV